MMAGNPSWWSMHPPSQQTSALLSSSTSIFPSQYVFGSSSLSSNPLPDNQELPLSWSQQLLGGSSGDEDRYGMSQFQAKKLENWEDQILNPSPSISVVADVKQEVSHNSNLYGHGDEDFQALRSAAWPQVMPVSSPRSCVTSISSTNILDFSYNKADGANQHPDQSSECNSTATGGVCKKARVQPSSSQPLKVRKEKLGDRITVLHQMVSPFGKTDTASVLLEAIGYIRFLQGQIEALSSPYLGTASTNMKNHQQSDNQDNPKDLRSRGLCLVPLSCTQHVGSDHNGADYWAPAMGGGF
ncbi:PREDICTED: transcription factor bHLH68-like isoform X2 [Populus euphratica]|uniref:Transcription factor bHLH68-like isoform X2 n=1 Tax=Populus euphratica TaxID=75702 RepID=A0AAJ6TRI0_POPEU|nr:PREDICTED: transcription factor bHLH68-like isoform X2 [Populus euphratica]XP_011015969.1 PREDICTED: transcription factor bHLH68-like isoform X2 [Populus euphratica]